MNQKRMPIWEALQEYINKGITPFDVPAHKFGALGTDFNRKLAGLVKYDVNSSKPLDNLANPTSIIQEAHELLAEAFGADQAYILINGTTQGIHAMMLAAIKPGEKILLPRNAHKSAINGVILAGGRPAFVEGEYDPKLGIAHNLSFNDVKEAIRLNPDAKAIFILNPTYYGVPSELKKIIDYAHQKELIVLCDEAHGTHWQFSDKYPMSAMEAGADMSAASMHKTAGSLTQSSILLWNTDRIASTEVWGVLAMLNSTSANYLLMSSVDAARAYLVERGKEELDKAYELAKYAREEIKKIPGLEVLEKQGMDLTKVVIYTRGVGLSGFDVYDYLRDEHDIQIELAESRVCMAVVSMADTKETIDVLIEGLKSVVKTHAKEQDAEDIITLKPAQTVTVMPPRDAMNSVKKEIYYKNAVNKISADTFMFYPPGIPLLLPGELVTDSIIDHIDYLLDSDAQIISNATEITNLLIIDEDEI